MSEIQSLRPRSPQPDERASRRRSSTAAVLASVGLHVVLIAILLAIATEPARSPRVVLLPLDVGTPETRVSPYLIPAPEARPSPLGPGSPTTGLGARVLPEPEPVTRPSLRQGIQQLEERHPADSARIAAAARPVPATHRLLRPSYGDGRLWVPPVDILQLGRPLPVAAGGGAGSGSGAEAGGEGPRSVAQLDSVVTARLRAFLDTMPPDSFAPPAAPAWTTQIAGKTWGMDGKWIYLGGIKLPAALLALLPFPQGNIDQARGAAALMQMREDIMQAAQRAQTAEDFRKYVKELRKRKDEEREAKKRTPRDTVIP